MTETTLPVDVSSMPDDFGAFERWRAGEVVEETPGEKQDPESSAAGEAEKPAEAKTESESETEKQEQEQKKHRGGFQRRIDKLTTERYALAQENEALRQRLAGTPPAAAAAEPKAQPAVAEGRPRAEDFKTYDEYLDKLTEYKLEQKEAERETTRRAKAAQDAQAELVDGWNTRLDDARKQHEDYDEVVDADVAISPAMQRTILEADKGAELAYYLGKHPEEAQRIAKLSPVGAVVELGKILGKLEDPAPITETKITSAPPPPKPVGGKGPTSKSIDDPTLSFADFEKLRNTQINRR